MKTFGAFLLGLLLIVLLGFGVFWAARMPLHVNPDSFMARGEGPIHIGKEWSDNIQQICSVRLNYIRDLPRIEPVAELTFWDGVRNTLALGCVTATTMFTAVFVLLAMAVFAFFAGIVQGNPTLAIAGPIFMILFAILSILGVLVMSVILFGALAFQSGSAGYYLVFIPFGLLALACGLGGGGTAPILVIIIFPK